MKLRSTYVIVFGLTSLALIFVIWTRLDHDNNFNGLSSILMVIGFSFFFFWRLYHYYKLEYNLKVNNYPTFIVFFQKESMRKLAPQIILPHPIFLKLKDQKNREIRSLLNLSTLFVWIFFILLIT